MKISKHVRLLSDVVCVLGEWKIATNQQTTPQNVSFFSFTQNSGINIVDGYLFMHTFWFHILPLPAVENENMLVTKKCLLPITVIALNYIKTGFKLFYYLIY